MEHLPSNGHSTWVQVPYIGHTDIRRNYTKEDTFFKYPHRLGLDIDRMLRHDDFGGMNLQSIEAFSQAWLYFGLLTDLFKLVEIDFVMEDFVRRSESGKMFITTEHLARYVNQWAMYEKEQTGGLDPTGAERRSSTMLRMLEVAVQYIWPATEQFLVRVREGNRSPRVVSSLSPLIILSIQALGLSLAVALSRIYNIKIGKTKLHWGDNTLLNGRLLMIGWCPYDIARIHAEVGVDCQYYYGFLDLVPGAVDHSGCTVTECMINNMSKGDYQTKHVDTNCTCDHLVVPIDQVIAVLDAGNIPVISWSETKGIEVHDVCVTSSALYVAVSHVWSDGRGNPFRNALPACQIRFLQSLTNTLYDVDEPMNSGWSYWTDKVKGYPGNIQQQTRAMCELMDTLEETPVGFWIDTLCVPVMQEHKQYRNLAITRMKDTYEAAHRVVVLDSGIQQGRRGAPIIERNSRIFISRWQGRLWTYQECLLAKNLHFLFQDGPLHHDDMLIDFRRYLDSEGEHRLDQIVAVSGGGITMHRRARVDKSTPVEIKLGNFANGVFNRTTTKKLDESICMATLLDINPHPLLQLDTAEERMVYLLRVMGQIKSSIVFAKVPRLLTTGYSWAPTSYLRHKAFARSIDFNDTDPVATIGPSGGLMVNYAALRFRPTAGGPIKLWYLVLRGHEAARFVALLDSGSEELILDPGNEYAILTPSLPSDFNAGREYHSALVTLCDTSVSSCLRVRFLRTLDVGLVLLREYSSHPPLEFFDKSSHNDSSAPVIACELVTEAQEWCIE